MVFQFPSFGFLLSSLVQIKAAEPLKYIPWVYGVRRVEPTLQKTPSPGRVKFQKFTIWLKLRRLFSKIFFKTTKKNLYFFGSGRVISIFFGRVPENFGYPKVYGNSNIFFGHPKVFGYLNIFGYSNASGYSNIFGYSNAFAY